jgi:ribosomal protein S17
MKTKIYALTETDGKIRYIGKTVFSLRKRFLGHLWEARTGVVGYKNNWIRSLLKRGFAPSIIEIGEVEGDGCKEEIAWIKYFRDEGVDLTNRTGGGDGASGYKHTGESLQKMSLIHKGRPSPCKGRHHSKEAIQKMRLAHKGYVTSDETRKKLSYAQKKFEQTTSGKTLRAKLKALITGNTFSKGVVASAKTRKKISIALRGLKRNEETRRKMRLARLGKHHSPETRIKIGGYHFGNKYATGRKHTPEERLKMSIAAKARCQRPEVLAQLKSIAIKSWLIRKSKSTGAM